MANSSRAFGVPRGRVPNEGAAATLADAATSASRRAERSALPSSRGGLGKFVPLDRALRCLGNHTHNGRFWKILRRNLHVLGALVVEQQGNKF